MKTYTHLFILFLSSIFILPTFAQINCDLAIDDFPWLEDVLDANDCCQNQKVYAYPFGIYTFIYIQKCLSSGPNELYFQDGTSYCSDNISGGCRAAYGLLESTKIELWDCSQSCGVKVDAVFSICSGESILLNAEQQFRTPPLGPSGPGGSPPVIPCTPQLVSIEISPTSDAFAEGTTGFMVSPTVNTIYRVRSIGYCGPIAPDDFTRTQHDTIDLYYEVVVDCSVDAVFSICPGESVLLNVEQQFPTPPLGPSGPDGSPPPIPCTPQLVNIEISPTTDALAIGTTGFMVSPTVTTIYRVRSIGYCGPIAPDDFTRTQHDTIDLYYEVVVDCSGNGSTAAIFDDYPWLLGFVNPKNCTSETITVYRLGTFAYVYIDNGDGTGSLFLEDGTFYCNSTPTYDCIAAYGFSEVIATWSCPSDYSNDPIFTNFSWLPTMFDPTNCTNDRVAVYNQGIFYYLLVNEELYFQDGTFYCQSTATYDCVTAYNFEEAIYIWDCQNGGRGKLPTQNRSIANGKDTPRLPPSSLLAYPNPTEGRLTVQIPSVKNTTQQLLLHDLYGRTLQTHTIADTDYLQSIELDLTNFERGIYFIEFRSKENRQIQRIVKQNLR